MNDHVGRAISAIDQAIAAAQEMRDILDRPTACLTPAHRDTLAAAVMYAIERGALVEAERACAEEAVRVLYALMPMPPIPVWMRDA